MKTIGIVAEFNPFHNGHKYFIDEARRLSGCDACFCVMSGNVSMRGEIAPMDKMSKVKVAMNEGIDMVIELPFFYTLQNANIFAFKSIEILNHLKVDEIYFGSESGDISYLTKIAKAIDNKEYNDEIKANLAQGFSYKKASMIAFEKQGFTDISSNDMLGACYIKAIMDLNSKISPKTITRIKSKYLDKVPTDSTIASATAIRQLDNIKCFVPASVEKYFGNYGFASWNDLYHLISYKLSSETDLSSFYHVEEGLNQALLNVRSKSFDELINKLTSKRYTTSRIKRVLASILFNVSKEYKIEPLPYIRILGMNEKGKGYLNAIKKNLEVPLITCINKPLHPILELELRVAKILSNTYPNDLYISELEASKNILF